MSFKRTLFMPGALVIDGPSGNFVFALAGKYDYGATDSPVLTELSARLLQAKRDTRPDMWTVPERYRDLWARLPAERRRF